MNIHFRGESKEKRKGIHRVKKNQRLREIHLAESVATTRLALEELLTAAEKRLRRSYGSALPMTFEDRASHIARNPRDQRHQAVRSRLDAYRLAVNNAWEYAEEVGITHGIALGWIRTNYFRLLNGGINITLVHPEASYHMRRIITGWKPGQNSLATYAKPLIFYQLDTWLTQMKSPVELPENVARPDRGEGARERRAPLAEAESSSDNGSKHDRPGYD